jgi:hypothetical protein
MNRSIIEAATPQPNRNPDNNSRRSIGNPVPAPRWGFVSALDIEIPLQLA